MGTIYGVDSTWLVIRWIDVIDKSSGNRQTFETWLLVASPEYFAKSDEQTPILFIYRSINIPDYSSVTIGIEDERGYKGLTADQVENRVLEFQQSWPIISIESLRIYCKPDSGDIIWRFESTEEGAQPLLTINLYGFEYTEAAPRPSPKEIIVKYKEALRNKCTLLLGKALLTKALSTALGCPYIGFAGGLAIGSILIYVENREELARALREECEKEPTTGIEDGAHFIEAYSVDVYDLPLPDDNGVWNKPTDAALGVYVDWVFPDNTEKSSLIIGAQLTYQLKHDDGTIEYRSFTTERKITFSRDAGDDAESAVDLSNYVNITHSELHARAYLSVLYDAENNYRVYVEDGYRIVVRIAINKTNIDATLDDLALRLYIINSYGEETLVNGEIVTIGGKQYLQAYYDVSGGYYVYIEVSVPDDPDDPDFEGLYDMFIYITASPTEGDPPISTGIDTDGDGVPDIYII